MIKKISATRMRGIVKMVRDTLTAAFYETQQKHAHPTFRTLQMLGLKHLLWFNSVLKIRVSAVRFCPRPPYSKPNPSRLGFFTSGLSPGCARFPSILRVPQAPAGLSRNACLPARFDSFSLSVLKKYPRTSPAEHTQKPFHDKRLLLMCCTGFDAWTTCRQ